MAEETLLKQIFSISEKLGEISSIVKRHDEKTFPEIQNELKRQSESLLRMESKQNKDILQFTKEKEAIYEELKPLKTHLNTHNSVQIEKEKQRSKWVDHAITSIITLLAGWIGINITK